MSISEVPGQNVPIKLWTPSDEVEPQALQQLKNIAALPWVFKHVAVMPDVHFGKGATVGSVIAMKEAVSPAAVGVDIGCGMAAVPTDLRAEHLPDSLKALRTALEKKIPVGFNSHPDQRTLPRAFRKGPLKEEYETLMGKFSGLDTGVQSIFDKVKTQVGTLGGGNHFIELCLDENDGVWLMLHSGSRNIGKTLAEIHMTRAKELIHNQELPDPDLSVFLKGTKEMAAYKNDLLWAQDYARLNRHCMLEYYKETLMDFFQGIAFKETIQCHHNYVSEETHFGESVLVTRKGAIRAAKGVPGIIPGSMGAASFIVEGLGNPESFESASHGAGRRMSRNKAKKTFKREDLVQQTKNIECRKDEGVIDEIPAAYKDIEQVMENQKDLVRITARLKQVLCVKG